MPEFEDRIKSEKEIGEFLRLVLIRCLREDRTIICSYIYIKNTLGDSKYIEPVTDSIDSIYQNSKPNYPVLFLLSAGADPTNSIDEIAKKKKTIL